MRVIYKEILEIVHIQTVEIHADSKILKVDNQNGNLTLWYLCDNLHRKVKKTFAIIGTENPLPENFEEEFEYLDSVLMTSYKLNHIPFVWHVFKKKF